MLEVATDESGGTPDLSSRLHLHITLDIIPPSVHTGMMAQSFNENLHIHVGDAVRFISDYGLTNHDSPECTGPLSPIGTEGVVSEINYYAPWDCGPDFEVDVEPAKQLRSFRTGRVICPVKRRYKIWDMEVHWLMYCRQHPQYLGARKPTTSCAVCARVYQGAAMRRRGRKA